MRTNTEFAQGAAGVLSDAVRRAGSRRGPRGGGVTWATSAYGWGPVSLYPGTAPHEVPTEPTMPNEGGVSDAMGLQFSGDGGGGGDGGSV